MEFAGRVFNIRDERTFNETALEIFKVQYRQNAVYRRYAEALGIDPGNVLHFGEIPFLPILFFRTGIVQCGTNTVQRHFRSSGTTGGERSIHPVTDLEVYRQSLLRGFEQYYGPLTAYDVFALMPSPDENPDSSLIFMVNEWIKQTRSEISGFYLYEMKNLADILQVQAASSRKPLVIGLSYALLDFADYFKSSTPDLIIMETGGMKGKREEMVREELHAFLKKKFKVPEIHSEYGMTELLSQAYSKGHGKFHTPSWMRLLTRDPNDPFQLFPPEKTGCLNIIDLANFNSCSFIATEDLGRTHDDGSFEMLGRFDSSTVRGCNLMMG